MNYIPHREAKLAAIIWADEFTQTKNPNPMEFWDALDVSDKNMIRKAVKMLDDSPTEEAIATGIDK